MELQERNNMTVTIESDGFRGIPDKQFEAVKLKKKKKIILSYRAKTSIMVG
jgi:hypothetical protein